MHRSKAEIYLHLVWTTWERTPLVTTEIEREVYRCIEDQARHLKCTVLAIGGTPNHVHIVVRIPTTLAVANLAKQIKGVSSTFVRDQLRPGGLFKWQEGFGVFSISCSHVARVVSYVQKQKQHHAAGKLWDEWEQTSEEVSDES